MMKMLHAAGAIAPAVSVPASAQVSPRLWFGTWTLRLTAPDGKPETLIYSDAGQGAMRMVSVEQDSVIVTRLDGRPAADTGRNAGRGTALAVKATSPTRYSWTFFQAGTPYVRGINTLAADRRSFTEVSWLVARPGKTVTLIYDRQ